MTNYDGIKNKRALQIIAIALKGKWTRRSRALAVMEALERDYILEPRRRPLGSVPWQTNIFLREAEADRRSA